MFFQPKGLKPAQITALREEVGDLLTVVFDEWIREWGKDLGVPSSKALKPLLAQVEGRLEALHPDLLHAGRSNVLAMLRDDLSQINDRAFSNCCEQIDPSFLAAASHLEAGHISFAGDELGNAQLAARQALGERHMLTQFITSYIELLSATPDRDGEQGKAPSAERPKITAKIGPQGFSILLEIPGEVRDRLELRKFLLATCQKGERKWAESNGAPGAYARASSSYSTFGTETSRGPRIYAPDGSYRGRITAGLKDPESIMSSDSRFGNQRDPTSMFFHLFGAGQAQCPPSWRTKPWRIVGDQG